MKISVEASSVVRWNVEDGTNEDVGAVRVEWQKAKGGKREYTLIVTDSTEPAAMLGAAAAYFEKQPPIPAASAAS